MIMTLSYRAVYRILLYAALPLFSSSRRCVSNKAIPDVTINAPHTLLSVSNVFECLQRAKSTKHTLSLSYSFSRRACKLFETSHLAELSKMIPEADSVYMENPQHPCNKPNLYPCRNETLCRYEERSPTGFYCKPGK